MFEKLNLIDEVSIKTKNALSIKAFIKRHKKNIGINNFRYDNDHINVYDTFDK